MREVPTLGGIVGNWIQSHVAIPDGDHQGEPFLLTGEQWTFLLHYYALDAQGKFVHRRGGLMVRPQKAGKSPFAAALIAAEAAGPTRFAGWENGEPVGKRHSTPWIQVAAVSEDQAGNVYRALVPMLQLGDVAHEIDDVGLTRIVLPGGGRIEPVTAAHRSRVGARTTFAVLDELSFWLPANHGHELADAMLRNLAGMRGRFVGITNAWSLNEDSAAERIAGEGGVFVDSPEPGRYSIANKRERRKALRRVYGDSATGCEAQGNASGHIEPWIDLDVIDDAVASLIGRDEAQARRFFLNEKVAADASAFDVHRFAELASPDHVPAERAEIVLAADGAFNRDALAVVACELETGFVWPVVIETRPEDADDDYHHDLDRIDGAVVDAFERFRVVRFYVDPQYIEPLVERWQSRWGDTRVVPWFTNRQGPAAHAVRRFAEAIASGELSHDGDPTLTAHVKNAVRRAVSVRDDNGRQLFTVAKDGRNSPRKIDAAMAGVMAWEARYNARREGLKPEPRKLRGGWFGSRYFGPETPEERAAIEREQDEAGTRSTVEYS